MSKSLLFCLAFVAMAVLSGPFAHALDQQHVVALEKGKPWFCHGLDCPKFHVTEKRDAYEVREYKEGRFRFRN